MTETIAQMVGRERLAQGLPVEPAPTVLQLVARVMRRPHDPEQDALGKAMHELRLLSAERLRHNMVSSLGE